MGDAASYRFKKEFEARAGDTVRAMVMARAYGSAAALSAAGLSPAPGKKDVWGILIFGGKNLHFFVHASESAMSFLFRTAARAEASKEQWAVFPRACIRTICVPEKKHGLLSFLFGKPPVLELSFALAEKEDGRPQTLYFETLTPEKESVLREAAEFLVRRPD